ncbi:MAG: 4Fe-4S cluster-binding domain-containing protein, partial [Lachnospiraceae bacterium]|nr:4Fe-4S cluster-binding domain-containing protein [Lachnospiraceae bacterium]
MLGDIMTVSRLRMATDGEGVSTLVAFYDCPLRCKYCINKCCHEKADSLSPTPRAAYRPEELIEVLRKDAIYYLMTGGGIVFGGGEPLLQSAFIHEVCKQADSGWKKRIETSLNVSWS